MEITALIMAGGKGERFWPASRENYPKQFLKLASGEKTMIQLTVSRILPMVKAENIFVATNISYLPVIREQLPEIPEENILLEPVARNTAPCIGLGAVAVRRRFGDALMMVLPSDHLITQGEDFLAVLKTACQAAGEGENLLTIGISPTYPETGFGYICYRKGEGKGGVYPVERFVEKPDRAKAEEYLAAGNFLWNSGMFLWKSSSILNQMKKIMPSLYEGLTRIEAAYGTEDEEEVIREEFLNFPSESIDYGIMEKAEAIYTVPADIGWDDVGSWLAVERLNATPGEENTLRGNTVAVDSKNCFLLGDKHLIAVVGLDNLIVVDSDDALLICDKDHTDEIRKVLAALKEQGKVSYL